jgi:hypothetical protein
MKRLMLLISLAIIAIGVSMCGTSAPPVRSPKIHLLVSVEGKVRLEREGWQQSIPVGMGTIVQATDLLDVQSGRAVILCADLNVMVVTAHQRPPCSADVGVLDYQGARFSELVRAPRQDIPYILYPRNTLVLDAHPLLRWHSTGAPSYHVTIQPDEEKPIWQAEVVGDQVRYPDQAPALQPDVEYLLVVQDHATGKTSAADKDKGLGFTVVDDLRRQEIVQQRDRILALTALDQPIRQVALAMYYAGGVPKMQRGLYGEAWLLLEQSVSSSDAPAIHRQIGDLLSAMKLPDEAVVAYTTALRQAGTLGDLETIAAAQAGLWRTTGDSTWLAKAIQTYEGLGAAQQADALRKEQP